MRKSPTIVSLTTLTAGLVTACGGGGNPTANQTAPPPVPQDATVTLLLSSAANARVAAYNLDITDINLTGAAGNSFEVLSSQQAELIHVNGAVEPLTSLSVPEDTYTSATITASQVGVSCVGLLPSGDGLNIAFDIPQSSSLPAPSATITLPKPITISASGTAIQLTLLVSQSASFSSCSSLPSTLLASPTFEATAVQLSPQPTSSNNGRVASLDGEISSVSASAGTFKLKAGDSLSWTVSTDSNTVYQGVSGFSALVPGVATVVDADLQADGTLLATRVDVEDPSSTNLTLWHGPLVTVSDAALEIFADEISTTVLPFSGPDGGPAVPNAQEIDLSSATFQTSSSLTNLQSLPFTPTFDATSLAPGQNVDVTMHVTSFPPSPSYPPASVVTLLPQTINGTVSQIANQGGFTTYTVTLAPYDLFTLQAQLQGQQVPQIVVYTDGNTQMLSTTTPAVGVVLRFNGLVFNDGGTLRMDCAEVLDGVTP